MKEKVVHPLQPLNDDEASLLELVDIHKQELIELVQELVKIDSRNYSEFEFTDRNKIVTFAEQYLNRFGFDVSTHVAPFLGNDPDRYYTNLIARYHGSKPGKTLQFCGHLDVVPYDESLWDPETPPLGAVIRDGKLYGRGAADMKSGVACEMMAMRLLKHSEIPVCGELKLWLTPDEETHGAYGSQFMAREHFDLVKADATLIAEASAMDPLEAPVFGAGEKGAIWLNLTFNGASGHGSRPKPKSNPINKAARFISQAHKIRFKKVRPRIKKWDVFAALFSRYRVRDIFKLVGGYHQARDPCDEDGLPLKHLFQTTCSFGKVNAGTAINVIPNQCTLGIDFRTMPGVSTESLLGSLTEYAGKLGYRMALPNEYKEYEVARQKIKARPVDIQVSIITRGDGSFEPRDSEFGQFFEKAFEAVYQVKAIHMLSFGFTDGGNLRESGMKNIFIMGPKGGGFHASNEYVELNSLVNVTKAYLLTAYRYLKQN